MPKKYELKCQYCGQDTELVTGAVIYPHTQRWAHKKFFYCETCGAYVGTHHNGKPLGEVANVATRAARQAAHNALDPLWRDPGASMSRNAVYKWLAEELQIKPKQCHIGRFDVVTCLRVVQLAIAKKRQESK